jgi:inhibitor of cysteine peptidase
VLLAAVAVALFLTAAACGGDSDSGADSVAGTTSSATKVYTERDTAISVAKGDEFVVALPANPSTGYSWSAQDDDLVTFQDSAQVRGGSMPGQGGTQRLTFRAVATGSTTLELAYTRPFEPGVPPAETASFAVTVTG